MPRPTPEQLLRQVQAEEQYQQCGKLKVFLGYASGVGKSFRMLDEGRRRRERGQDVVVGATQPRLSPELAELLAHLEVIPLRQEGGVPVMDLDAILRRHPRICLVDGLAYDNPAGSRHAHRWQDVEELLDRGISVLSTVNLQYVEECREEVERIRGKHVNVTVPGRVLRRADEIVVVDAPADTCLDCAGAGQLREIALLLAADVVDEQLETHRERNGLAQTSGLQERLLVCLTPKAEAARMIERAQLIRDRFHGELFAVYVGQSNLGADDQMALERNLDVARAARAGIKLLQSEDPVAAIMQFAREHSITQIFIGHSLDQGWRTRFTRTFVDRLIRAAEGIDVKLFPH